MRMSGALLVFCVVCALRAQTPPDSEYERWLDQDVRYLIGDSERAAFQALQTDDERQHFIEQFWQRRDPTPGTAVNEFQEEHYRRIAYSNSRFVFGQEAGWRTERGRAYIVHGPPDEIESHPSGGRSRDGRFESADPYEIWGYRPAAGSEALKLTFVAEGAAGRYVAR